METVERNVEKRSQMKWWMKRWMIDFKNLFIPMIIICALATLVFRLSFSGLERIVDRELPDFRYRLHNVESVLGDPFTQLDKIEHRMDEIEKAFLYESNRR